MVLRRAATVALVIALAVTGCAKPKGTSTPSSDPLEITYTLAGVQATEIKSAAVNGHWDKFVPNASAQGKLTASVTADRQGPGLMQCMITYQDTSGDVWIVDYVRDVNPGSITCRSDASKVKDVMANLKPADKAPPPGGCGDPLQGCPGPDSLNLNVTWFATKR